MKILYVHNEYAKPSGEEHAAEAIATLLAKHDHEVYWFKRRSTEISHTLSGKTKAFFAGAYNPASRRDLKKKLDEVKPDLVQVQNLYPLLSLSIFSPIRRRGIPVVMRCPNYRLFCPTGLHFHNGQVCEKCMSSGKELWCIIRNCEGNIYKSTGYALRNAAARLSGSIVNNVDMFLVQTEFQKQKFIQGGIPESRIAIIPAIVQIKRQEKTLENGGMVTFVGRISPEKGVEDFLETAKMLPQISFAVAGDYTRMPEIRDSSPINVTWLGFLGANELKQLYLKSAVVVVPSRWYEGFPNVIVEAFAYGIPVIVSRLGGMAEIVEDGITGLHFEAGNAGDITEKVKWMLTHPTKRMHMGENARRVSEENYTPKRNYEMLMEIYNQAINKRK